MDENSNILYIKHIKKQYRILFFQNHVVNYYWKLKN
jgi:hypothetical protein